MTQKIYLNNDWEFTEKFDPAFKAFKSSDHETVRIPHSVKELPFNYVDEKDYQMISGYRKVINYDSSFSNKRVFLNFEGAAHSATVWFNDRNLGTHNNGYTAFRYEISQLLKRGRNRIVVRLNSKENLNIPPFGGSVDYLTYGGIYRDVYLSVEPKTYIADAYIRTRCTDDRWYLDVDVTVDGKRNDKEKLGIKVYDENGKLCLDTKEVLKDRYEYEFVEPILWTLEYPHLYKVVLNYGDAVYEANTGFRSAVFREDGFYLNGEKLKLRGLNRHQSYPYVGYAMPDSMQREDVRILKNELGCNIVRTSHYPQSPAFFDECDRRGLLVFTEIPGWQHLGDAKWKEQCLLNVEEMIMQNRNHPSIILWGVRVNESLDDDELYTRTNELAHRLDPYRQTSGVRYLTGSSLLEDVYGHNDFSFAGDFSKPGLKTKKKAVEKNSSMSRGYLVTEHNGHMFPTKPYDDYKHRVEHALRHAQVLDSMYEQEDIAGAIGWCMFDYNTHRDFGSGDRICYHGVMDCFRNPKIAAAVYASQSDYHNVMEVASCMELGEYAGGSIGDTYVFTNADSVRLYKNNEFVKEFFPGEAFKHLPHPPIVIDDYIGELIAKHESYDENLCASIKECLIAVSRYGMDNLPIRYKAKLAKMMVVDKLTMDDATRLFGTYVAGWGGSSITYRFDGVKNGKVFRSVTKRPSNRLKLKYTVSSHELKEGKTYDVASIRFSLVDENDSPAVYSNEIFYLSTTGNIKIIGPDVISLQGGTGATFVKTVGKGGKGTIHIDNDRLGNRDIEFTIKKEKQ